MKKIFGFYLAAVLIVFLIGFYQLVSYDSKDQKVDLPEVNDIVMTAREHWDNPEPACELAKKAGYECAILDFNENMKAKTDNNISTKIFEAVENRETVLPVLEKDKTIGYVIVSDGAEDAFSDYQSQILTIFCLITGTIFLLTAFYFAYLSQRVIKPFGKLKRFAGQVAQGNLDLPLQMDRANLFGEFTESFDIMREELAAAKKRQYVAEQSKKELIASLSHDIKTPVASIRAAVELLQVTTTDDKEKDKLIGIERKTDQIELLINNLFHATLEELQELEVKPCEESSKALQQILVASDYSCMMDPFVIPECLVYCDRLRVGQVFDNIVSNSYKYANTKIVVESKIIDNALQISIRDYGSPLSEHDIRHCTDKFYRGENKEGKNGAGLGLYISSYFMKKMGGSLEVYSNDGFEVRLYLALV